MAEYIDREAAFDAITDLAGKAPTRSAYEAVWKSARVLKKVPTADIAPAQRWIPLAEQLPPMDVDVLLCHDYGCTVGFWAGDGWGIKGLTLPEKIYAWMPIPEVPREMFI